MKHYLLYATLFISLSFAAYGQQKSIQTNDQGIFKERLINDWYLIKDEVTISSSTLVKDKKQELGLSNADQLVLTNSFEDNLGIKHNRYQQFHKGIEVLGGTFITHEISNRVKNTTGSLFKDREVDVQPTLDEDGARQLAIEHIGAEKYMWEVEYADRLAKIFGHTSKKDYFPNGKLMIIPSEVLKDKTNNPQLAYEFLIHAASPHRVSTVYVDAHSGEVILERDGIMERNTEGTAQTRFAGEQTITTDHFEEGFRLRETRGASDVNIITLNMNRQENLSDVTEFTDADNYWNNRNEEMDEEATDIHWGQETYFDYLQAVHGWNSFDNQGGDLIAFGHWGDNIFNAQAGYFGPNGENATRYGDGGVGGGLTVLDIVGHEITHNVFFASIGGSITWDNGGLNESFADIFGVSSKIWIGIPDNDIWILSDEVGAIRNLRNPNSFGDPDTWQGRYYDFDESTSVHTNGNVQNHCFYLLVEGGSGVNDNGDAYDVQPIGLAKAEKIAFRVLTVYLTGTAGFPEARIAWLAAAEDLYGIRSAEYEAVANAWYAVGVGGQVSINDVGISSITSPTTSCDFLSAQEDITVTIKYFGGNNTLPAGTEIPISVQLDDQQPIMESVVLSNDITGGDEVSFTLTTTLDLSERSTYLLSASTLFPDDPDEFNDTKTSLISSATGPLHDVGVSAMIRPDISATLTTDEIIEVSVKNYSCFTLTSGTEIPVTYSVDAKMVTEILTLSEDLASEGETNFTFSKTAGLDASASFTLDIFTALESDPISSNNGISFKLGAISDFPYVEGFEDGAGGWISEALKGPDIWQVGSPGQPIINSASSGSNVFMTGLSFNYTDLTKAVLVSPAFNFSDLQFPSLCFDIFFVIEQDWDAMIVEYSTDGSTWEKLNMPEYNSNNNLGTTVTIGPPWYSGSNGGWATNCINLSELGGESSVRFRFHFESDDFVNDEGVALDNIVIDAIPNINMGLTGIISPSSSNLGSSEAITLLLENFGQQSSNSMTVGIRIDGGDWVTESGSVNIPLGDEGVYSTTTTFDFSTPGFYEVDAYINVSGDIDNSNDSLLNVIVTNTSPFNSFPYLETFDEFIESSSELTFGWSNEFGNDLDWSAEQAGTYSVSPQNDNTSGSGLFLSSDMLNLNVSNLLSPQFDISSLETPLLEFYYQLWENGSTSSGSFSVDVIANGVEFVDEFFVSAQNHDSWQRGTILLTEYESPVQFRFKNQSNGAQASLVGLDDVSIAEAINFNASIVDLRLPNSASCLDNDVPMAIEFENKGVATITSVDLSYTIEIDGNTTTNTETLSNASIQPGEVFRYVFTNGADLSMLGEYTVTGTVVLTDDADNTDNSLSEMVINNESISDFPDIQTFVSFDVVNPTALIDGWYNEVDHDIDWMVAEFTPTGDTGPAIDHSGDGKFIYVESSFEDQGFPAKTANLISPCVDISSINSPVLEFFYHMQSTREDLGDAMGSLQVDVYDGTWHEGVWTISGNQGFDWNRAIIPLTAYQDVLYIRFAAITGTAQTSDIALDDIKVYDSPDDDLAIVDVVTPLSGCGSTGATLSVDLQSRGSTEYNSGDATISYSIDNGAMITETIASSIASFQTVRFDFAATADFTPGYHEIEFTIDFGTDGNISNNSYVHSFYVYADELFAGPTLNACEGETVALDVGGPGVVSVTWAGDNGSNPVIFTTSDGTYSATVTYENGCTASGEVEVSFRSSPISALEGGDVCKSNVVLDPGNYSTYLWQDGSTDPTLNVTESGTYFVTVSNESGCYSTVSTEINLSGEDISADFTIVESGDSYTFTPTDDTDDVTYLWDFGDGTTSSDRIPTYGYSSVGSYEVTLVITKSDGSCEVSSNQVLEVTRVLGLNDLKALQEFELYPNPTDGLVNLQISTEVTKEVTFVVYSQSGQVLFQSDKRIIGAGESVDLRYDLTFLNGGIYFAGVRSSDNEGRFYRIIINK